MSSLTSLEVSPCPQGLKGSPRVPGDKSISHRALILSALAEGVSRISNLSDGQDVAHTAMALESMGAQVTRNLGGLSEVRGGPSRLHEPLEPLYVGNSGTSVRLLAGVAAGLDGLFVLFGDRSLARRPMGRVTEPLGLMGARIDGRAGGEHTPLVIRGGGLSGLEYRCPVPSAQVKSAVLLAGLFASGPTSVVEPLATRNHTEEMLSAAGVEVRSSGTRVTLWPGPLRPMDWVVPADPSQAAFWVVAAAITPGSEVCIHQVYLGPGRAGFLEVLKRMGAQVEVDNYDPASRSGDLCARYGPLRATEIGGAEVPGLIDEIPVLAVAAACAEGETVFKDAAELRVKESDRIASVVAALRAMGADAYERPDGLVVRGGALRGGARVDSQGDHRVAMAAAVGALAGSEPVRIEGWESVATSYPGFEEELRRCASWP